MKFDNAFSLRQAFAKLVSIALFSDDIKKQEDYELNLLAGLEKAGVSDLKEVVLGKASLERLTQTFPKDFLDDELFVRAREYQTIHDLVDLMIRANASGGMVQKRNSLNRAVAVLSKEYDDCPNAKVIHGIPNIIETWGKWKKNVHLIFAYYDFLDSFDEKSEMTTEMMFFMMLILAQTTQDSLMFVKSLKLQGQMHTFSKQVQYVARNFLPELSPPPVFTPEERKEWLAYRAHYESKPKKGDED